MLATASAGPLGACLHSCGNLPQRLSTRSSSSSNRSLIICSGFHCAGTFSYSRSASSQQACSSSSAACALGKGAELKLTRCSRDQLWHTFQVDCRNGAQMRGSARRRRLSGRPNLVAELGSSRPSSGDHFIRCTATTTEAVATRRMDELQRLGGPLPSAGGSHRASASSEVSPEEYRDSPPEWASGTCTESVESEEERRLANPSIRRGVPVFVMLPLDTVRVIEKDGVVVSQLKRESSLDKGLETLKRAGVEGVMVDVWWGLTERNPKEYDFAAYEVLFDKVHSKGLKVQAVMSFHAAGGNVGDTCQIPLPDWVMEIGESDPNVWFTDLNGVRNMECLSLGCDDLRIFQGRTPVEMYHDFISAFSDRFQHLFGDCMTEITVGMGPAGSSVTRLTQRATVAGVSPALASFSAMINTCWLI